MKTTHVLILSALLGVSTASAFWLVRHKTPSVSAEVATRYGFADPQDVATLRRIQSGTTGKLSEEDFAFLDRVFRTRGREAIQRAWTPLASIKDPTQQERALVLLRKGTSVPHFDIAVQTVLNNFSINNEALVVRAQSDPDPVVARVARMVVLAGKGKRG